MTSGSAPDSRYNERNAPDYDVLGPIRCSMREAHESLSWGQIAKLYGITKPMAYRIALEGYTPKDRAILRALQVNHVEVIAQVVKRDGAGRFRAPLP